MRPSLFLLLRARSFRLLVGLAAAVSFARAASTLEQQVSLLFRPLLADQITLSPDGKHVAYTRYASGDLTVQIVDVDRGAITANVIVGGGRDLAFSKEKEPARLRFLKWATPNRLVFAPTIYFLPAPPNVPLAGPRWVAPIMAIDADGKNPKELVDSRDFETFVELPIPDPESSLPPPPMPVRSRPPRILGFPADNRNQLLIEVKGFQLMRDDLQMAQVNTTDVLRVDVFSGKRTPIDGETPTSDYVYDWQGHRRLSYEGALNATDLAFNYRAADGKGGWQPIAARLPAWDAAAWRATPANFYGERVIPLGFDYDPNVLYVASNVGRDTFAVCAVDTRTGGKMDLELARARTDFGLLTPAFPSPVLVFDEHRHRLAGVRAFNPQRTTLWRDEELDALQDALEESFPRQIVEILDWSADRARFLVRVSSATEPGRCLVYQRAEKRLREITRRAPWLEDVALHEARPFAFTNREGTHLSGTITAPRRPRLATPPVVISFASDFPGHVLLGFDPEAQVLAEMGFVVVRLNQRGTLGFGRRHLEGALGAIDRAAVADARDVIEWLATYTKIDRKRVATFGRGFGGYLAVRALQLEPEVFRCAIALDAPLDPEAWLPPPEPGSRNLRQIANRAWLERAAPRPEELSAVRWAGKLTKPVLLVVQPGRNAAIDTASARLRGKSSAVESIDVANDFELSLPLARARVYRRMEEFFNVNLYDFDVKLGETKEVK